MEERKRRITRKYLRERTNVTQSDSMVPVDRPNEEQIADSKRFQEPKVAFERQEPGMQMQGRRSSKCRPASTGCAI